MNQWLFRKQRRKENNWKVKSKPFYDRNCQKRKILLEVL